MNTTYIPWSNFVYYLIMNVMGHAFVNQSNLNFYRYSWIKTNSTQYRDCLLVPIFAPIFWLISSIIVLRAREDIDSTTPGYRYPIWNVWAYNTFGWTLPYFIGLQFTHLDKGIMTKFVLTPEKMKTWPAQLWMVFVAIIVFALGMIGYMIYAYYTAGVILFYIAWIALIMGTLAVITLCRRKTHKIHVHHYTIGMIVIALIGYQSLLAAFVQAFCNGMMIEGGSRWGYDPIWYPLKKPEAPVDKADPPPANPAADATKAEPEQNST
jgi:hypothetical protein